MKKLFLLPVLLLAFVVGACGDGSTEPKRASATGAWTGSASGWVLNVTLSEASQSVSGSGNLTYGSESIALTISGSNAYPNISLTLSNPDYQPINFQGTFSDERTISGTLSGSGFNGESFTITKK